MFKRMKKLFLILILSALALPVGAQQKRDGAVRREQSGGRSNDAKEHSARERKTYRIMRSADWTQVMPSCNADALNSLKATREFGFQSSHLPRFVITTPSNRFIFGIGGYVNLRTAYDLGGAITGATDFIPYYIPVPDSPLSREKLTMSSSTTRLFFKAIANTEHLGRVVAYIETDFRGGSDENDLRLRKAYIQMLGFTLGRDVTTFCDLGAAPRTIDFEGPNAYNFNFNQMIRYTWTISPSFTFAAALENPQISGVFTSDLVRIAQRVPDLPLYVQWNFGRNKMSHLRASGVLRDLVYYNLSKSKTQDVFAWGAQLSGNIHLTKDVDLTFQSVCGRGIGPYIQELTGRGFDLVPDVDNADKLQALPMYGWQAALKYSISKIWSVSGGYSQVGVDSRNGYKPNDLYHRGTYIFGNSFLNLSPDCVVALEYLHGSRTNMDSSKGAANRIQAMVQYNF